MTSRHANFRPLLSSLPSAQADLSSWISSVSDPSVIHTLRCSMMTFVAKQRFLLWLCFVPLKVSLLGARFSILRQKTRREMSHCSLSLWIFKPQKEIMLWIPWGKSEVIWNGIYSPALDLHVWFVCRIVHNTLQCHRSRRCCAAVGSCSDEPPFIYSSKVPQTWQLTGSLKKFNISFLS